MNKKEKLLMFVVGAILIGTISQTFGKLSEDTGSISEDVDIGASTADTIVSASAAGGVPLTAISQLAANPVQLKLFKKYLNASYVADGIGVRNTGRGTISLRLPEKATLKDAWLYWMILNTTAGIHDNEISVNGIKVKGTLIGNGTSPCWSGSGFSYRANINAVLTTTGALGGGAFGITIGDMNTAITSGPGQFEGFSLPAAEYAGLVIVYFDPSNPASNVTIYNGYYEQSGGMAMFSVPVGTRIYSSLIGDGQVSFGQNSVNYTNAAVTTTLQKNTLAGADPSIMSRATIQGSLADTDTFVPPSPAGTGATLTWNQASDCLSYEALVFTSANPGVFGPFP